MGRQERNEIEKLIRAGKLAGEKAREETFALGYPVHIIEDGNLVEIDKDGNKTVIKKLDDHIIKS